MRWVQFPGVFHHANTVKFCECFGNRRKHSSYWGAGYTHNNPEQIKNKALGVIYELLNAKPEQEQKLLAVICNKLGDPERKVAAKARHLLAKLVDAHPNMKGVIVQEIQHVLARAHLAPRAQYAVICFLNQLELSNSEASPPSAYRMAARVSPHDSFYGTKYPP